MRDSGVYTRRRLAELGYDDAALRRAVAAGDLDRLRPGWYAAANHDPSAAAAVRDGGVLTCVDALAFHGLWVPPGHRGLHLRRSRDMSGRQPECMTHRGRRRSTAQAVDPVPLALLHAACCLGDEEWIAVCDSHLNSTGADQATLFAGCGPVGSTVASLLQRTDGRSQSGTESISRVRLRAARFEVVVQPRIVGVGRADLRIGRLIIECDSVLHHSSRADYERDHHRDRQALVDGWMVLRLTYDDVIYGWDAVLSDIRRITDADRHRARSARHLELLRRSSPSDGHEGDLPP